MQLATEKGFSLAATLHWSLMALAFIDDSGSGGDSIYYVLAGYVGSEGLWGNFAADWQSVLDLNTKLEYFKMNEAHMLDGQFSGFTVLQRDARLRLFIDVVLRHMPLEASVLVPEKQYSEVLYPVLHKSRASPYYSAFLAMVTALSGFYRHSGSDEMVDFVFDEQDGMQNKAGRLYARFRGWFPNWQLGRIAFENDKKVLPLQAADLIAWQIRRFRSNPQEKLRHELERLHSARKPFQSILRRQDLQNMADAINQNIPALRKEFGDEKVDRHLASIERRNLRDAAKVKKPPTN